VRDRRGQLTERRHAGDVRKLGVGSLQRLLGASSFAQVDDERYGVRAGLSNTAPPTSAGTLVPSFLLNSFS